MSFPWPNELEASELEAVGSAAAGSRGWCVGPDKTDMAPPQPKQSRHAFAPDVEMPQVESEIYTGWACWRESTGATFGAFVTDDEAAKVAGQFHVALMNGGRTR